MAENENSSFLWSLDTSELGARLGSNLSELTGCSFYCQVSTVPLSSRMRMIILFSLCQLYCESGPLPLLHTELLRDFPSAARVAFISENRWDELCRMV